MCGDGADPRGRVGPQDHGRRHPARLHWRRDHHAKHVHILATSNNTHFNDPHRRSYLHQNNVHGDDGRYIWWRKVRELRDSTTTIGAFRDTTAIEDIICLDGTSVADRADATVALGPWARPVRVGGRAVPRWAAVVAIYVALLAMLGTTLVTVTPRVIEEVRDFAAHEAPEIRRRAEERVQKLTDEHVAAIDAALKQKEEEIMEV